MNMRTYLIIMIAGIFMSCGQGSQSEKKEVSPDPLQTKVDEFAEFELKTDLDKLTEKEKLMLPILFDAANIMEELFWIQAYGNKEEFLTSLNSDVARAFAAINYGPWERLNNNAPFLNEFGEKPKGAKFYPADMTVEEFEAWDEPTKTSLYTMIERNDDGELVSIPYHQAFAEKIQHAANLLRQASTLAEDAGLKNYLELRADALQNDDYYNSDVAWLDMKSNTIDFVVGPIENYEDQLFGYKTSFESFILVKDKEWSQRLEKFAALLPNLQTNLPCPPAYKNEMPGSDSDLNAYDVIYYAGDCNAGSKTIAINLPNDEKVRNNKGSRKLQLKNSMQAKFDKILVPIADVLIVEEQRKNIQFDAFFENTMFHEVAHGLGLGNTIDGSTTVREALKETYTSIEESKADILGLWVVTQLAEMGELGNKDLMDNFVTFMAGIFRSVRFGAASAHGKANMIRFYYFQEKGAFERTAEGYYRVNFEKMKQAMLDLTEEILIIQGDGNYEKAASWVKEKGFIRPELQADLDRISEAGIPRDIVFKQGPAVIGL